MVQAHIFYSGVVQGVGFRFTARELAQQLSLKGWVRNLSDGRVEILAEGLKQNIEDLIQELDGHFGANIHSKEIELSSFEGKLSDFLIYPTS